MAMKNTYARIFVENGALKLQTVVGGNKKETLIDVDAKDFEIHLQLMPFNANHGGAAIIKLEKPEVNSHIFHIGTEDSIV